MDLNILYEDKDIIVCVKPPKVPAQSDRTMDYDMVSRIKNHLNEEGRDTYVGVVHRLDRPVGGVMVYALSKKAAAVLSEDVREHRINKCYVAVAKVQRDIMEQEGEQETLLENYLVKNAKDNTSKIVHKNVNGAKLSQLRYRVVDKNVENGLALIRIELITGRHHQIRVQMAECGLPLYGDTKYGEQNADKSRRSKWKEIALFAYRLKFVHPCTKKELEFQAFPENFPVPYNNFTDTLL